MTEDEKVYKISAELPGIKEKDIDVAVSGDMLRLKGEKRQEKEEKDKNYHFSERAYGSFQRSFECRRASIVTKSPPIFERSADDHPAEDGGGAEPQKKIEVKSA